MAKKYYAVKAGKKTGIYETWDECKEQVDGYSGASYKSFKTIAEAFEYMGYEKEEPVTAGIIDTSIDKCHIRNNCGNVLENLAEDCMVAYVDGSYNDTTKEFSHGMIAFYKGETIRDCKAYNDQALVSMRNVAGEIKGSEAAMKLALEKGCTQLHIYHDYEGIAKWPLGEWKTNKEGTIAYKQFYDSIKPELRVMFHKVTGHSGDKYNDEADRLAKLALNII